MHAHEQFYLRRKLVTVFTTQMPVFEADLAHLTWKQDRTDLTF